MAEPLRLMCVLAHPDDESLGFGGALARYAAEGVETYLVTATRGERGWFGAPEANPGLTELGRMREQELHAAARALGLRRVDFLDYIDGDLDQADPAEAIGKIVGHLRRVRPQVVLTFGLDGAYGHPDHIAISQFTTAAIVAAADHAYAPPGEAPSLPPHRVSKLYHAAWTEAEGRFYEEIFGEVAMVVDGVKRGGLGWPEWMIITRIEASDYWRTVWEAVRCHRTQLPGYEALTRLTEAQHRRLWGSQGFARVFSHVNGGRSAETDLFAGLR